MRASEQVRRIKAQLVGTSIKVVAKVETAEAVEQLATIIRDADARCVANQAHKSRAITDDPLVNGTEDTDVPYALSLAMA